MAAPAWFRRWWANRQEYLRVAGHYRQKVRAGVRKRVRQQARTRNLWFGVGLALVSLALYVGWASIRHVRVDTLGLAIAAIGPSLLAVVWWVIWFRFRAPSFVLDEYKRYYDQLNPPSPWSLAVDVHEDERKVAFRLLLNNRYSVRSS